MFLGTARTSVECFFKKKISRWLAVFDCLGGSGEKVRALFRHLHHEQLFAFFGFAYMRRNEWILLQGKRIVSRQGI